MYKDGNVTASETCPQCPGGCDITRHGFTFVVNEAADIPDGPITKTEILGFFQPEGTHEDEWTENVAETADLIVPLDSPIARMAREILRDPTGDLVHVLGETLRQSVMVCPCNQSDECPALGEVNLLHAMETALSKQQ